MSQRSKDPAYLTPGEIILTTDGDKAEVQSISRRGVQTVVAFRMLSGRYRGEYAQQTVDIGLRCLLP
jgi:hypothetical protein